MPLLTRQSPNARESSLGDPTAFGLWTRSPVAGAVLPLVCAAMSVVRLATETTKREQQIADLFKAAPKDVRDAGVAELAVADDNFSDVVARIVISTGKIDSYNSTINPRGWDTADFRRNPVVLFAHNSWALPVGRDVGVFVDDERNALLGTARFVSDKMGVDEAKIGKWVAAGALNAASVGFEPQEWDINEDRDDGESWFLPVDFQKQALREYSIVPVPANTDCLVDGRSLRAGGIDPAEFRRMIEEALDGADVFFLPRKALLDLKRAHSGDKIVVDLGNVGSFDVQRAQARPNREQIDSDTVVPADAGDSALLVCPECGYEGPDAEFSAPFPEGAGDEGKQEPAKAAAPNGDNPARVRHAHAQEVEEAALVDMAGEVVDLIQSGRLPR